MNKIFLNQEICSQVVYIILLLSNTLLLKKVDYGGKYYCLYLVSYC